MSRQTEKILAGFSENQRCAALERDKDIILRAGAGSGKTKTLVGRYLTLLDEHRDWLPENITAVTFTKKAAQEMQNRIREQMLMLAETNAEDPEEQLHWLELLNEMDNACIGTIHSLCGRILRAYPAEAEMDPQFETLEETDSKLLRMRAATEMLELISKKEEYVPLLSFYKEEELAGFFEEMLSRNPEVDAQLINSEDAHRICLKNFLHSHDIENFIAFCRETGNMVIPKSNRYTEDHLLSLADLLEQVTQDTRKVCSPYETLQNVKNFFSDWSFRRGSKHEVIKAARDKVKALWEQMCGAFPCLEDSKQGIDWYRKYYESYDAAAACLRNLWPELQSFYRNLLQERDVQDFDSLENNALKLLREHPEIASDWETRIKALLVDEYQDTNTRQAELFSLLNKKGDRLFVVGDKKQSIYGFRGSEVALFGQRAEAIAKNGGADLMLDETFRTDPMLLKPMGELLKTVMADPSLEKKDFYAPYEPMQAGRKTSEDESPSEPRIEVLLGGEASLAQRLLKMKQQGTLKDWGEVAILFRRSFDFAAYENALESYHIPYVTVSGQGFYERQEIRDVINLLKCAENPWDNTLLCGALLSPVLGFTPSMLVLLHRKAQENDTKVPFWQVLKDETFIYNDSEEQRVLLRARDILVSMNAAAGKVPLDQALERLYALTGFRTMLAGDSSPRGWQNLDKMLMDARNSGMVLVSDFLRWLKDTNTAGTREGEAPSESEGAVRLMTIHKAKGLEFPITVIANPEQSLTKKHRRKITVSESCGLCFESSPESPQYLDALAEVCDREKAEWLRLLYVAVTRAERRLIFSGSLNLGGEKTDSWLKRILKVIPLQFEEKLGSDTSNEDTSDADAVNIEVVDQYNYVGPMRNCGNDCLIRIGLDSEASLLEPTEPDMVAEPPVPDVRLLQPVGGETVCKVEHSNSVALAVGNLVHKALECWCFPGDPRLKSIWERLLLQSDRLNIAEREQAQTRAEQLLARFRVSEVYQRIENAEARWHEIPFSTALGKYSLNGVIDILLREPDGFVILDFKTDALQSSEELRAAVDKYAEQLSRYRNALRNTLRSDAECGICFLDNEGKVTYWEVGQSMINMEEIPEASDLPDEILQMDLKFEDDIYEDLNP